MKTKTSYLILLLLLLIACRRESQTIPAVAPTALSLEEVRASQRNSSRNLYWDKAAYIAAKPVPYWLVGFAGRPRFDSLSLGYRAMLFYRDSSKQITARILEIIPDAIYLQRKQKVSPGDFTGRVFTYDTAYHLLYGRIYSKGKEAGQIKPAKAGENHLRTNMYAPVTECLWMANNYVDGDGNAVIFSEKICSTDYLDTGSGGGGGGGGSPFGSPTGTSPSGGGGSSPAAPPAPSNLPGEDKSGIDPKEFMKCFQNIPDNGATMKITIYVQEPWPGTTFNMGPNSVGHTAISLTKTNGSNSITQTVGFYPDATGFDKMHAPSKLVDNGGDLDYSVSISYTVSSENFNKIVSYISSPPATYDITDFNCTNFVNSACLAGNINLPNPITYSPLYPSSPLLAPGALGDSIQKLKGSPNVNTDGGNIPLSNGPCN